MENNRPENIITTLKAIGEFTLLVCGIIGIAVEIFHDDGLLRKLLSKLMDSAFSSSMIALVGVIAVFAIGAVWYDRVFSKVENIRALGDFLMKAMMLTGAYFLYLFLTTGSFKI